MLQPALAFAAQLLWPARCAACDVLISPALGFCAVCAPTLLPLGPGCLGCAMPLHGARCGQCAAHRFAFARARAAFGYGGALTEALLRFKHGRRIDLARPLGRSFLSVLAAELAGADAILPVPLHPRRLRDRGFNQALELVRGARASVGRRTRWPPLWVDTLRRLRDTPALGRYSPQDRRRMVAGAFAVSDRNRVQNRRLLLVDDVMTTGATLDGCTRVLLEAGAAEVRVAALARAL